MYTIGQVSEMFNLPISTLRYYDKQGLFPEMVRESGIRKFSDTEIEALRVIECLKNQRHQTIYGLVCNGSIYLFHEKRTV